MKLALIALVLFSGFSVYQTVGPEYKMWLEEENARMNEVIVDQVLYIEGLPPIQLLGDNEFKKVQIEEYIENNIKTQPAYLLNNVSMINICNQSNLDLNRGKDDAYAFARGTAIFVANEYNSYIIQTITHELSHVYDNTYSSYEKSSSAEFQALWNKFKYTFKFKGNQEYYNNTSKEFFAEASAMYVNNPESLKSQWPELYNYFANIYVQ